MDNATALMNSATKEDRERLFAQMTEEERDNVAAEVLKSMSDEDRENLFAQLTEKERSVLLPGGKTSLGKDGIKTEEQGLKITPKPGFTLKSRNLKADKKVFINICVHEEIGLPGMKKKLNEKGEEVEGYNLPMSVGPERTCPDNKGIESIVVDMIVNPEVMVEIREDVTGKQRDFICQLAMQCVENKYKMELDKRYKLPNNLEYIGEVASQYVKDRKKTPKIDEVSSTPASDSSSKDTKKSSTQVSKKTEQTPYIPETLKELPVSLEWQKLRDSGGDNDYEICPIYPEKLSPTTSYVEPILILPPQVTHYVISIDPIAALYLLKASSSNGDDAIAAGSTIDVEKLVKIDASPFKIQIKINGYKPTTFYLPTAIKPNDIKSVLDRSTGGYTSKVLRISISLPIDRSNDIEIPMRLVRSHNGYTKGYPNEQGETVILNRWDDVTNGDAGSRPWLVANALNSDNGGANYNPYASSDANNAKVEVDNNGIPLPFTAVNKMFDQINDHFVVYSKNAKPGIGKTSGKSSAAILREQDEEILPEDRFHQKDAGSQYIIQQREQEIANKHSKHEE